MQLSASRCCTPHGTWRCLSHDHRGGEAMMVVFYGFLHRLQLSSITNNSTTTMMKWRRWLAIRNHTSWSLAAVGTDAPDGTCGNVSTGAFHKVSVSDLVSRAGSRNSITNDEHPPLNNGVVNVEISKSRNRGFFCRGSLLPLSCTLLLHPFRNQLDILIPWSMARSC